MILYKTIKVPLIAEAESLTIGFFDGLHLGHKFLLDNLSASKGKGKSALVTFSNHPRSFFSKKAFPLISSLEQKLTLLQSYKIDFLFLLPFDKKIADTPFSVFLKNIHTVFPFKKLLLGKGSAFGKNREGTEEAVKNLAPSLSFTPSYFALQTQKGSSLCSSKIREEIQKGNLSFVESLLGRRYSLYLNSQNSFEGEKKLFSIKDLCLPPEGDYVCSKHNFPLKILKKSLLQIELPSTQDISYPVEIFPQKKKNLNEKVSVPIFIK